MRTQRGAVWRLALSVIVCALLMLGVGRAWVDCGQSCACPCAQADAPSEGPVAERPSCCPAPDERVTDAPSALLGADAPTLAFAASPPQRLQVGVDDTPGLSERPRERGPPRSTPVYLMHRTLLL